jgi:Trp operon repressor
MANKKQLKARNRVLKAILQNTQSENDLLDHQLTLTEDKMNALIMDIRNIADRLDKEDVEDIEVSLDLDAAITKINAEIERPVSSSVYEEFLENEDPKLAVCPWQDVEPAANQLINNPGMSKVILTKEEAEQLLGNKGIVE